MKRYGLLLMTVAIGLLVGCGRKGEVVVETTEVNNTNIETTKDDDFPTNYDIRVEELPDNDTGVKNPQTDFRERFGLNSEGVSLPDDYVIDKSWNYAEELKRTLGDEKGDLLYEYQNSSVVTEELNKRMTEAGFREDKDHDGLYDNDEYTVYGSDPNKFSTADDMFSDFYKVNHDMDVNKYYDFDWKQSDEFVAYKKTGGLPIIEDKLNWDLTEDYLDEAGLRLYDFGMSFEGDIRLKVDGNPDDMILEVFNVWDLSHAPIEFKVVGDNEIEFHVDLGYAQYLLHDKSYEFTLTEEDL